MAPEVMTKTTAAEPKMLGEGAAFEDVLKDAQAKGYAERNPAFMQQFYG